MREDGNQGRARKHAIRAEILAHRAALSDDELAAAGTGIAKHAAARWPGVVRAACYLNSRTEPPTGPLIDHIIETGGEVIVPVIDGEELDWAACDPTTPVEPGPLGIRQPVGARLGQRALATIDVAFVPALCVDGRGTRLGRGLGYFDRALAGVKAPVVAIVFDDEYVEMLPVEAHDRPVDAVLMPGGLLSLT